MNNQNTTNVHVLEDRGILKEHDEGIYSDVQRPPPLQKEVQTLPQQSLSTSDLTNNLKSIMRLSIIIINLDSDNKSNELTQSNNNQIKERTSSLSQTGNDLTLSASSSESSKKLNKDAKEFKPRIVPLPPVPVIQPFYVMMPVIPPPPPPPEVISLTTKKLNKEAKEFVPKFLKKASVSNIDKSNEVKPIEEKKEVIDKPVDIKNDKPQNNQSQNSTRITPPQAEKKSYAAMAAQSKHIKAMRGGRAV